MAGKLIVFEGGEGCGKSTQLQALQHYLTLSPGWQQWCDSGVVNGLVVTREPGGTSLGGTLRQLLLNPPEHSAMASQTELLLYAADRAQHVEQVIRPALDAGKWVLCDRFVDSTVAYQGYGRGLDLALIEQLNQIATGGLAADLTLWLQLDAAKGLARTHQRGATDRMEQANLAFHRRVQRGFEQLAQQHPQRIVPIAAEGTIEQVSQSIFQIVDEYLRRWYQARLIA